MSISHIFNLTQTEFKLTSTLHYSLQDLINIIQTLRGPNGCPWDKSQTTSSIAPNLLEEVYEVIEAIESDQTEALEEELGDLLFVVLLASNIAESEGRLQETELIKKVCEKMIRRHPHVFGDAELTPDEIRVNWAAIKAKEKPKKSRLDGIPKGLPALQKASRLGQKASMVGFDWPSHEPVLTQVELELAELKEAMASNNIEAITHEIGDVLLSMASLSRHLRIDPESALRQANQRFTNRFHLMENTALTQNQTLSSLSPDELEALWRFAKTQLSSTQESS